MTLLNELLQRPSLSIILFVTLIMAATLILAGSLAATLMLRRQSAALRHRVWTLAMSTLLLLPCCLFILPSWGPSWLLVSRASDTSALAPSVEPVAADAFIDSQVESGGNIHDAASIYDRAAREELERSSSRAAASEPSKVSPPQRFPQTEQVGEGQRTAAAVEAMDRSEAGRQLSGTASAVVATRMLAGVWLAGTILLLLHLARSMIVSRSLVKQAFAIDENTLSAIKEEIRTAAGVTSEVPLLCSSEISVPLTYGVINPVILLPAGFGNSSPERMRVVLAHEMAHIARRDVLAQFVARLACALYWCHPLVWLANWRMRIEREFACDDAVLEYGQQPTEYAEHLVDVAAALAGRPSPSLHAVAMASHNSLEHRVRAILQPYLNRTPVSRRTGRLLTIGSLACVVLLSMMSPTVSEEGQAATEESALKIEQTESDSSPTNSGEGDQESETENLKRIQGVVVDADGTPIASARIKADWFVDIARTQADEAGRFTVEVPADRVGNLLLLAEGPQDSLGFAIIPYEMEERDEVPPQEIKLQPPRQIDVRVLDRDEEPVSDAHVIVDGHSRQVGSAKTDQDGRATIAVPEGIQLTHVLARTNDGIDYFVFREPKEPKSDPYQLPQDIDEGIVLSLQPTRELIVEVIDEEDQPIADVTMYPWYIRLLEKGGRASLGSDWTERTNTEGTVTYSGLPVSNEGPITFYAKKEGFAPQRFTFDLASQEGELTITMLRLVPVTGKVAYPDGTPAQGIEVLVNGDGYGSNGGYRGSTMTSNDGTFRLEVEPNHYCAFVARNEEWASPMVTKTVLAGNPISGLELTLRRATRIFGQLTTGQDNQPIPNAHLEFYQQESDDGNDYYRREDITKLPNPTDSNSAIVARIFRLLETDEQGRYEAFVGPGHYYLIGPRVPKAPKFHITDQDELEVNLHAEEKVTGVLQGRIVSASNPAQGVAEAKVVGRGMGPRRGIFRATTDAEGRFEAKRLALPILLGAFNSDDSLGGIKTLGTEAELANLALEPTTTLRGVLVHEDSGEAAANREMTASIRLESESGGFRSAFRKSAFTDDQGHFEIVGIVPRHAYVLDVVTSRENDGRPGGWRMLQQVIAKDPGVFNLGDVELPEPYRPPTLDDRIAAMFSQDDPPHERFEQLSRDADHAFQQLLVIIGDPNSIEVRRLLAARYEANGSHPKLRQAFSEFMLLGIRSDDARFLSELGVRVPDEGAVSLAITTGGESPRLVAQADFADVSKPGRLDRDRLTRFLTERRVPLPDAKKQLNQALSQATFEDKQVFVHVSGPGCAPCIVLSRYLREHKSLFEKDYVLVQLDARMPRGEEVIKQLRSERPQLAPFSYSVLHGEEVNNELRGERRGVPWMAILAHQDSRVLITSDYSTSNNDEENIGFPATDAEKAHFKQMLLKTRQRLSDDEIESLISSLGD